MAVSFRWLVRLLVAAGTISTAFSQTSNVWMKLFNGTDFTGWKGKLKAGYWVVDTGHTIVGTRPSTAPAMNGQNTFLFTDSLFSDFRLKMEGRMPGSGGYRNSGIMYRSTIVDTNTYAASGYQYEISDGGTGAFYHERGTELNFTGGCAATLGVNEFKKMEIVADGPHVTHYKDGKSCFDYKTFKVTAKGLIAVQLHAPGDFIVNFRNIFIQPLNNSFVIPANNAWDSTGKQIGIVGIHITPKLQRANQLLGIPNSILGYDAQGRAIPAPADWSGMGPDFHAGRVAPGLYIRAN